MNAHIAAGLATAPRERWQHGQVRAPDTMTRAPHAVACTVHTLHADNTIGDRELDAADRFRRDYLVGIEGVRETTGAGEHSGGEALHAAMLLRCRSLTAHRAVADIVGGPLTGLLVALIVEDMSIAAMARQYGASGSTGRTAMSARMQTLLMVLVGVYAKVDAARRSVARHRRAELRAAGSEGPSARKCTVSNEDAGRVLAISA